MKRIGEDISEKLDYTPGVFSVERHVRGKWTCAQCQTLTQAPVPPHIIDKRMPTTGLLAQVLIAKFLDHLPLYRQEGIFGRAGLAIPRSTLAQWVGQCGVQLQPLVDALRSLMLERSVLHADETPVAMLVPGKGKTHTELMSGRMARRSTMTCKPLCMTLRRAGRVKTLAASSTAGAASSSAMTTPDTRRCSPKG